MIAPININGKDNSSALGCFYNFACMILSIDRADINKLEDIDPIDPDFLLKYETWQQFAGHLRNMAVAGTITVNTAEVYFNAAKLAVKTRNREAAIFKEDLWQTQLVHNMIQAIKQKCIADQIPFEKRKTSPIGIDGLGKVSYYLLCNNNLSDVYPMLVNVKILISSDFKCHFSPIGVKLTQPLSFNWTP